MNIKEFKKGDVITRIEPSKPYSDDLRDRSYMGDCLEFVGIANNQIYYRFKEGTFNHRVFGNKVNKLPVDIFEEGWELWVNPNDLVEGIETKENLQQLLNYHISVENYEKAEEIKRKMDNL